ICTDIMQAHKELTGKSLKISHTTVIARWKGRKSRAEAAQNQEWLLPQETEVIIKYLVQSADQAFPSTHRRLKTEVDKVLRARLGDEFPAEGVGRRWTERFVSKHSDRL
ncbi:hypothetical protein BKA70DRAFT_1059525, partial [Coprinopsis sp. MPI-PUGE-AT-0042]